MVVVVKFWCSVNVEIRHSVRLCALEKTSQNGSHSSLSWTSFARTNKRAVTVEPVRPCFVSQLDP